MTKPKNQGSGENGESQLKTKFHDATELFEQALKVTGIRRVKYILRLYVNGSSTRSLRAVDNLKKICEEYLLNDYDLEIIDLHENPTAAREEQIIAVPTLVKQLPKPLRKFVGDLSNTQKVLIGLDIYKRQDANDQLSGI